ncbi:MAG TPA: SAM-dependent chlorinase/fluorinase, partial [Bacteroidia bacterium]|nr:SAM-dependent chlorinase/fluorinase [Bacteroidia bacterium]
MNFSFNRLKVILLLNKGLSRTVPIVTLTSDLGKDTYQVAKAKMQLEGLVQGVKIFDISHDVSPFAIDEAAYLLNSCINDFPEGTVHIMAVDADIYKYKRLLAAFYNKQVIMAVDNGFLPMLLEGHDNKLYEIPVDDTLKLSPATLRNVVLPAAAGILNHGIDAVGALTADPLEKTLEKPLVEENSLRGKVVYVNNYHNSVTNISRSVFDTERMGRYFEITLNRYDRITDINDTYSQQPEGECLCFFNENGLLEIAVNRGKASQLLGLE